MDKRESVLSEDEKKIFKGGVRSIMVFLKENEVADEAEADSCRFIVFDKNDKIVYETYGSLKNNEAPN